MSAVGEGRPEWRDDEALWARIRAMTPGQRRRSAYFALRRVQGPLVDIAVPDEWGIDSGALASLLRAGAGLPVARAGAELRAARAALMAAPLFTAEVEPELVESFQLEALNGWLMFVDALGEMSEADTERIVRLARELAVYLDDVLEGSLTVVPGEEARARWVADADEEPRAYGLGYFGTRNLEVEAACHEALGDLPADADPLGSAADLSLEAACDAYGTELSAVLATFTDAGAGH
ncbi:hypothetical protein [Actinacidiphila acidipaludis]|uniref:Uncharacterized protein n=1 Tax=Actinacidiphila acidipaludis TaxID=2873382 RepID=A0ABS7Q489_9ACTN|nr:hypothetical protein [Streptomyces acidipaludis]MBY8876857.1 hypothetical protein [Streptomyces acidipaludis]